MGSMAEKICLDTDVCIALLKGETRAPAILHAIAEKEVVLSVITLFELMLRRTNIDVVKRFIERFHRAPLDDAVARHASRLQKELAMHGAIIDVRDIFIAATCIANDYSLLTFNRRHFERFTEIKLVAFE